MYKKKRWKTRWIKNAATIIHRSTLIMIGTKVILLHTIVLCRTACHQLSFYVGKASWRWQ